MKKTEPLVKIDPKNLEFCSIELKALLKRKLKDKAIKLEVVIYSDTNSLLNVEIEDFSVGGATLCWGSVWPDLSFMWKRKSSMLPLSDISLVTVSQLAKIKRWTKRYMEELATYYVEELKGNKND